MYIRAAAPEITTIFPKLTKTLVLYCEVEGFVTVFAVETDHGWIGFQVEGQYAEDDFLTLVPDAVQVCAIGL